MVFRNVRTTSTSIAVDVISQFFRNNNQLIKDLNKNEKELSFENLLLKYNYNIGNIQSLNIKTLSVKNLDDKMILNF